MKTTFLALVFLAGSASFAFAGNPAMSGGSYRGIDNQAHPYNTPPTPRGSSVRTTPSGAGWKNTTTLSGTPMQTKVDGLGYHSRVLINGQWH